MAKAKKKEAEEGAAEADAPKGGKKKLIIIAAAAVLVIGGGAGAYFVMGKKDHAAEEAAHAPAKKTVAFVDLKDMTVNLAPTPLQQGGRFMKLKVSLEVSDPKIVAEITPLLPRVEDSFQVYMRELRASDLEGSAGTYRLKEELLRRVNIAVHPAKVDALLFKELLVQ